MKPKILIGGLGALAAGLGLALWFSRSANAGLEARVTHLARQNADLRYELKQATRQAGDVGRRAVELDTQLGSTKTRTTAVEVKNTQLTRELSEREQREIALMEELTVLRQRTAAGAAADDPARQRITELEGQLVQLLTRALAEPSPGAAVPAPAPAPHQVVRVGPADAFVVLDYGAEHGAALGARIGLQRGTFGLAQVQISEIRPRFSVAQVLPASVKGKLQSGDLVVFTP